MDYARDNHYATELCEVRNNISSYSLILPFSEIFRPILTLLVIPSIHSAAITQIRKKTFYDLSMLSSRFERDFDVECVSSGTLISYAFVSDNH